MANYAALIDVLTVAGSRLSTGSANASGVVYFFQPGGNTPVDVYTDAAATTVATQPLTLTAGGLLNRTTFPNGIYVTQPVRLLVQDVDGNTVVDTVYVPATAGDVGVDNDGFTDSTLDGVLDKAFTSFGGQDWKYKESGGATSRTIKAKFQEQGIWVTDYDGVDPTGVGVSTTGIQAAFNRAKALSTNVLFPDGTFKTDQAITMTGASGVKVIGAGRDTTIITPTHATANAFTFTACASGGISGMSILHTTGSTGAAVAVGGASPNFAASGLYVPANGTYAGFAYGFDFSGASDFDLISYCDMNGSTRTGRFGGTSSTKPNVLIGNQFGASGAAPVPSTVAVEFNGGNGPYILLGNRIIGNTSAILYNASFTGTSTRQSGNTFFSTGAVTIDVSGFASDRDLVRLEGNDVNGYAVNVLSGATATPDRSKGRHIRISGTLYISFRNAAGGAITGWTMAADYHLSAGPSTTDGQITSYHLKWDADASVWREFSRAVTT
jgi:hypothetical protein